MYPVKHGDTAHLRMKNGGVPGQQGREMDVCKLRFQSCPGKHTEFGGGGGDEEVQPTAMQTGTRGIYTMSL
jgi:hypothetical protein